VTTSEESHQKKKGENLSGAKKKKPTYEPPTRGKDQQPELYWRGGKSVRGNFHLQTEIKDLENGSPKSSSKRTKHLGTGFLYGNGGGRRATPLRKERKKKRR